MTDYVSIDTLDRADVPYLQGILSGPATSTNPARRFVTPMPAGSIGYHAAHSRARTRLRGQACAHCGGGRAQAAYRHDASVRWVGAKGMSYSPDPLDYFPLCVTCHRAYDKNGITIVPHPRVSGPYR